MLFLNYIWDFDGTLFDTYPHVAYSLGKALEGFGIHADGREVLRKLKQSVSEAVTYYSDKYDILYEELAASYDRIENGRPEVPVLPYPGAAAFLEAVIRSGGRHFLYTHRNETAKRFLRDAGFEAYFQRMITAEDGFPRKPAPDAIRYLIRTYGLMAEETVMIGDRALDLEAGRNAGIAGILFDPDGYYQDYPADYAVRSMEELNVLCKMKPV
ncbi:MAG TPA: HAD-IA family hydrolase [Candidatus Caccomorpha excrementavium]|nr:HAD-IA family hydrolase [Candidatus Caccomorpha excrementavium]